MSTISTTIIADNTYGTIASGLSVGDTALVFTAGHGARFPVVASPNVMYCVLLNAGNVLEEIKITAHAAGSDSATIVREQGGTSAKVWSAGDRIEARVSSAVLEGITAFRSSDIATANTVTRTIEAKARDILSLKDAKNTGGSQVALDGAQDDTTGIQSVLDVGGLVFHPGGTGNVGALMITQSNTTLLGAGRGTAIFKAKTDINADVIGNTAGVSNIRISGISIDGNNANQSIQPAFGANGIGIIDASQVTIDDVEIHDTRTNGIRGRKLTNSRIVNNYFRDIGKSGISASAIEISADSSGNTCHSIEICNNNINNVTGTGNGIFTACDTLGWTNRVIISNNVVFNAPDIGIEAQKCLRVQIIGNLIFSPGNAGVYWRESRAGIIANNYIEDAVDGIAVDTLGLTDIFELAITGNIIKECTDAGIDLIAGVQPLTDITVMGNGISNCSTGIKLGSANANAARINIIGNNLSGNSNALTNNSTATTNRIEDNRGYNPVGSSSIVVGASPFSYVAGATSETIYISGGTVSDVSVNATIFATTNVSVHLGPNQSVQVTYSGAPTMTKYVH